MTKIHSPADVTTREDLVAYLATLAKEAATENIENHTTARYLEAAGAWAQDCDGAYARNGENVPSFPPDVWKFIATMFDSAISYE